MSKKITITPGEKYGKLTILTEIDPLIGKRKKGGVRTTRRFQCICECGNHKVATMSHLRSKVTKSCGCLRKTKGAPGERYGRLIIISEATPVKCKNHTSKRRVICKCECGTIKTITLGNVKNGKTKSCGCLRATLNGQSKHRLYGIWRQMINRTYKEKHIAYVNYGGRGIKVCPEWKDNYFAFKEWSLKNGYSNELTLERKNVNQGYNMKNCTWATREEQANNTRSNIYLTINNEKLTLTQLARKYKINPSTVYHRYKSGDSGSKLIRPSQRKIKK